MSGFTCIKRDRKKKDQKRKDNPRKQKEKAQRKHNRSSEFDYSLMIIMAMQSCHVIINKENRDHET